MQVYESIDHAALSGPTFLTIGNFDGVHRGHRALITSMRKAAHENGAAAGLLTFHPHPRSILRPSQAVSLLTSLFTRLSLYEETGLDFVILQPFTPNTAHTPAAEFIHRLHSHLRLSQLWIGPDFALGRNREGNVPFLRAYGKEHGFETITVPEFYWEEQNIRTSRIRRLIEIGNVAWAANWLGRFYWLSGIVIHGVGRGSTLGIPTANLAPARGRVVPANGVYATWAWLQGQRYPAVTNIGLRPTVQGTHRTIETHIIDFEETIYGRCMRLEFIARLRDEVKFAGLEALVAQIERDRAQALSILQKEPSVPQEERFKEVPFTADWGVEVRGETLAQLFAHSAIAMFSLQGAAEADGATVRHVLEIDGADREDLLVRWLSELLWLSETEGVLFLDFDIHEITDTRIVATASGRVGHSDMAHIKAVTYHDLYIKTPTETGNGWKAQILFDT
ncbi:MAG: bifunctional riboflavin kinase/FAD synthetase [Chloroflexi bacterium]|nr:bifunctional riboflavin kinase/FAD synthetase [Chloroflexota bacterium]